MYAVITGASSGIGEQLAKRLAKEGYDLILVARRRERLTALSDKLKATHKGLGCDIFTADLMQLDECQRLSDYLEEKDVEIFINNSVDSAVLKKNPELKTTKKNKDGHGNGIESVKKIVEKYDGLIQFSESAPNEFGCSVMLPYVKIKEIREREEREEKMHKAHNAAVFARK